jgi:hypothetical protein
MGSINHIRPVSDRSDPRTSTESRAQPTRPAPPWGRPEVPLISRGEVRYVRNPDAAVDR